MDVPKLYWSSIVFVPALVGLAIIEPVGTLVAALGLFALWVGLRSEA